MKSISIRPAEGWGQLLATCALAHLICLCYFLLRSIKDALIITHYGGVGILPMLKLWGLLPILLLAGVATTRVVRQIGHQGFSLCGFGAFALLFALFALLPNLPLSLLYIAAELWKAISITMIFWGFMALRNRRKQAAWRYPLYLIMGSCGGVMSQLWMKGVFFLSSDWKRDTLLSIALLSLLALILYQYLFSKEKEPLLLRPPHIRTSLLTPFRSPLLPWIGLLIMMEYVALQLIELQWKESIYSVYPTAEAYCRYMSSACSWSCFASIVATLLSPLLLVLLPWEQLLLWTPLIGLSFGLLTLFSPAFLFWGMVHNCLFRASKQAFSDPARECAYLELEPREKIEGKAFVCAISPALGKVIVALITPTRWGLLFLLTAFTLSCLGVWRLRLVKKSVYTNPLPSSPD